MSGPVDIAPLAAQILSGFPLFVPGDDAPPGYYDTCVSVACELARAIVANTRKDIPAGDVPYLEVGTEWSFVIRVRGTVTDRSADDASGRAYEITLDHRDFSSGRSIAIEHDEIIAIDHPAAG